MYPVKQLASLYERRLRVVMAVRNNRRRQKPHTQCSLLYTAGVSHICKSCLTYDYIIHTLNKNAMEFRVNGNTYTLKPYEGESLLSVLRDRLDLTGSKYGCGEGSCGACTVLIDGNATRSCVLPAASTAGKEITTIEGLAKNDSLHPVQQAFLNVDVFQCSYCAPGMVMSAVSLLKKHPQPTPEQIIQGMQGNICRCGTYPRIVKAIHKAARI